MTFWDEFNSDRCPVMEARDDGIVNQCVLLRHEDHNHVGLYGGWTSKLLNVVGMQAELEEEEEG